MRTTIAAAALLLCGIAYGQEDWVPKDSDYPHFTWSYGDWDIVSPANKFQMRIYNLDDYIPPEEREEGSQFVNPNPIGIDFSGISYECSEWVEDEYLPGGGYWYVYREYTCVYDGAENMRLDIHKTYKIEIWDLSQNEPVLMEEWQATPEPGDYPE